MQIICNCNSKNKAPRSSFASVAGCLTDDLKRGVRITRTCNKKLSIKVLRNKKIPPSDLNSTQRDNMSRWIKFVEPNAKWVRPLIYSNFQRRPVVQNRNGGPLTVFNHGSGIVASSSKLWSQRHPLRISRPVVTLAESTLGNRRK